MLNKNYKKWVTVSYKTVNQLGAALQSAHIKNTAPITFVVQYGQDVADAVLNYFSTLNSENLCIQVGILEPYTKYIWGSAVMCDIYSIRTEITNVMQRGIEKLPSKSDLATILTNPNFNGAILGTILWRHFTKEFADISQDEIANAPYSQQILILAISTAISSVPGGIVGASVVPKITEITKYLLPNMTEFISNNKETILGAVTGAQAGAVLSGPIGAIVGAAIGIVIVATLQDIHFETILSGESDHPEVNANYI